MFRWRELCGRAELPAQARLLGNNSKKLEKNPRKPLPFWMMRRSEEKNSSGLAFFCARCLLLRLIAKVERDVFLLGSAKRKKDLCFFAKGGLLDFFAIDILAAYIVLYSRNNNPRTHMSNLLHLFFTCLPACSTCAILTLLLTSRLAACCSVTTGGTGRMECTKARRPS